MRRAKRVAALAPSAAALRRIRSCPRVESAPGLMAGERSGATMGAMERIAVTARLKQGSEARARELLASGPPFDAREIGLRRHDVYLGPDLVVFVFEGGGVEETLSELVNDPISSGSFSAWASLLAEQPRLALDSYHWDMEETWTPS
jgi:hypothetical protein